VKGYKRTANLWRACALLQIPVTALAVFATLVMFFSADTVIQIPPKPQPGYYLVRELPDTEFINLANEVVSLLANYQPSRVQRQYRMAKNFLWEPFLSKFAKRSPAEVDKIVADGESQHFRVDTNLTRISRDTTGEHVTVTLAGKRTKLLNEQRLPGELLEYHVKMTTISHNISNAYGIVVVDIAKRIPANQAEKAGQSI